MKRVVSLGLIFAIAATLIGCPPVPLEGRFRWWLTHADNGGAFTVHNGGFVSVEIPGNPSTGYFWMPIDLEGTLPQLTMDDHRWVPAATAWDMVGTGGYHIFEYDAEAEGTAVIQLGQFPPGANPMTDAPEALWTATITVVGQRDGRIILDFNELDSGEHRLVPVGARLHLEFLENPGLGETWTVVQDGAPVLALDAARSGITDVGSAVYDGYEMRTFWYDVVQAGTQTLEIDYGVPGAEPIQTFELMVQAVD